MAYRYFSDLRDATIDTKLRILRFSNCVRRSLSSGILHNQNRFLAATVEMISRIILYLQ